MLTRRFGLFSLMSSRFSASALGDRASARGAPGTHHAAALLAAVEPGRSAAVERAPALVQALAAGPVVAAGAAQQVLVRVSAVTGSPPAVGLAVLHKSGRKERRHLGHDSVTNVVWETSQKQCRQKLGLRIASSDPVKHVPSAP